MENRLGLRTHQGLPMQWLVERCVMSGDPGEIETDVGIRPSSFPDPNRWVGFQIESDCGSNYHAGFQIRAGIPPIGLV